MKPIRIQRKRTKGWKMPENTVYVGRPTKWGNPYRIIEGSATNSKDKFYSVFRIGNGFQLLVAWALPEEMAKSLAIEKFEQEVNTQLAKKELRGKNLACFCREGEPCHADVLLKIANYDPIQNSR